MDHRIAPNEPQWKRIDPTRILRCQVRWLCQICGWHRPPQAWVIAGPSDESPVEVATDDHVANRCP